MKPSFSPTLAGGFVLGALALLAGALLSFRSCHLISRPGRFVAYFNQAVQGLDSGSAVRLRGVRVGRVLKIEVHYDSQSRKSQVQVTSELDQDVLSDPSGTRIQIADSATMRRLVEQGLRARVDLVGITGLQFVELEFLDPVQFPAPPEEPGQADPVVPTVASSMSELVANLSKIVSDLNKADFASLSHELKTVLTTANRKLTDLDLKRAVDSLSAAAESIGKLAGADETRQAFASLLSTANAVQGLTTNLQAQVEPVRTELLGTLRSYREAADMIHGLLGNQSGAGGLGEETVRTLRQVADAAESMQRLADFLERNPGSLLTGRKPPAKDP